MEEKVMPKRFYSVKDFHRELGGIISVTQVYRMIDRGEIPVRKIGDKIVIPADWVQNYLNAPAVAIKKVKQVIA